MADDTVFTLTAPQSVEVGEQFVAKFELNAKGSDFKEPNFSDFQVLSGPNSSTKSNINWVNGNMIQDVTYTFTYVLIANKEGECTIPPAIIKSNGKTYQSNFVDIKVVANSNNAISSNNQQPNVGNTPLLSNNNSSTKEDDNNDVRQKIRREINEDLNNLSSSSVSKDNSVNYYNTPDNIEERYDPYNQSKYDKDVSWTFHAHSSNDVEDLRAEVRAKHIKSISLTIGVIILLMALIILIIKSRR